MERKELEVYSEASNYGIIRMPGRHFPGCVVQGDSLHILVKTAEAVCERAKGMGDEELIDAAEELVELLADRLGHYESVLTAHGIELPYVRRR